MLCYEYLCKFESFREKGCLDYQGKIQAMWVFERLFLLIPFCLAKPWQYPPLFWTENDFIRKMVDF